MAEKHSDLGFVADDTHDDLGFVPEPAAATPPGPLSRFASSAWEMVNPMPIVRGLMNVSTPASAMQRAQAALHAGAQMKRGLAPPPGAETMPLESSAQMEPPVPPAAMGAVRMGQEVSEGNLAGAAGTAAGLALPHAVLGGLKRMPGTPESLRESARQSYSRAMGATKERFKAMSKNVVEGRPGIPEAGLPPTPGLIERGVTAWSRTGLQNKIAGMVGSIGDQIDAEQAKIPYGTMKLPLANALKAIDDGIMEKFTVEGPDGKRLSAGPMADRGIKVGQALKRTVTSAIELGPEGTPVIDYQLLRRFRQNWDNSIQEAGGFANKTFVNNARMGAYKEAANGIRSVLNEATPDIAALNREFHFWKQAQDVIDATVERTKAQSQPLGQQIAQQAGRAVGATMGIGKMVLVGETMKNLRKLTTSTAWNTMGAVAKDRLANAIVSGDAKLTNAIILGQLAQAQAATLAPPPQ